MFARFFSFLSIAVLVAFTLAAALPGTHRIIFPEAFGMTQISPGVWTDAPQRSAELRSLANASRARVADFFGGTLRKPNLILCATKTCARTFGIRGNGLSIPLVGVMVSPGGLTAGTLTHEMTHFRLHRSMGLRNLFNQPYPTWFDEGLATHVANHPRWPGQVTAGARERIRNVRKFWQWDDAYRALGVGQAYGTAGAEVARIEAASGRAGLLELINRAEAGEDFDDLVAEIMSR